MFFYAFLLCCLAHCFSKIHHSCSVFLCFLYCVLHYLLCSGDLLFNLDLATSGNEFARELATLSNRDCVAPYEKTCM
jgi:hypothetical protein